MSGSQANNKLCRLTFLDDKTNHRKHNIHECTRHNIDMHDPLNSL